MSHLDPEVIRPDVIDDRTQFRRLIANLGVFMLVETYIKLNRSLDP